MSSQHITPDELNAFFLMAYLALEDTRTRSAITNNYIDFRYNFWKDDERVSFIRNLNEEEARGLIVSHPLSIPAFERWLFNHDFISEVYCTDKNL